MNHVMQDRKWVSWALIALFILWFAFSVTSYFVVYKPFSPLMAARYAQADWLPLGDDWAAAGAAVLDGLTAVWLAGMMLGIGLWAFDLLTQRRGGAEESERIVFGFGLGFGVVGLLVLVVGLAGWLNTAVLAGLAVALTVVGLPRLVRLRPTWPRPPRPIALYVVPALLLAFTLALLPPTAWDSLFYHLTGPQRYLAAGRIAPGIDVPHFNFPSLMQMNFLLAMAVRGDVAAQLLHFAFIFPLAGIVSLAARKLLGLAQGWTAVLFLLATPMVLTLSTWAYNDVALAFYAAAALVAFLRWRETAALSWLLLAGAMAGFAISMKYTSFVAPLFLGLLLLWDVRADLTGDWKRGWQAVLAYGGTAALVAAPWYVKNFFFTGNPVYPFVFGGRFWDEFRAAGYANAGSGIGLDPILLLRLPYDLTLGLRDASQDGLTGGLYLAFLPLLIFFVFRKETQRGEREERRKEGEKGFRNTALHKGGAETRREEKRKSPPSLRNSAVSLRTSAFLTPPLQTRTNFNVMLLYGLVYFAFWVFGVINSAGLEQSRLLLPAFVVLCPPLAWVFAAIRAWDHPQFSLRSFLNLALGFVLAMLLVTQVTTEWLPAQPWAYLTGAESREAYLTRRLGAHYAAMETLNETLPPDAVVLFLWEPRSYYCEVECRPDSILDEFDHAVYLHETPPAIADAWRAEGITHVLLWRTGLDFIVENPENAAPPDTAVLATLTADHLDLLTTIADSYELYTFGE